ncbi:MAG: right-handed parallel beta-helix repeat-containing protein [Colwellia sp.]|nr:right-handed parallel beta-helix repeat-containing protein [Colwellia sp.]
MQNKTSNNIWKKSLLSAVITSTLLLSGCTGDDGTDGAQGDQGIQGIVGESGTDGTNGVDGTDGSNSSGVYTTSNYEIPSDSIFIAQVHESLTGSVPVDGDDITEAIITATFDIPDDAVIVFPRGRFIVKDSITIFEATGLTLMGYGINETQLDFSQSVADDAVKFEGGRSITIRDFSVYESPKNGIKASSVDGIYFAYTGAIWEGPLESDNGAYGLYPVKSNNVLLEHNYAYGSADAGIYVGQSTNIVVRNNIAKNNVAGIEIENSTSADVYNNLAIGNTGGILVFDLPGLTKAYGGNVRIFNNDIFENNEENVGNGVVGIVPPGTGSLIFATSDVEIYNNHFKNNNTSSLLLTSYFVYDSDFANYTPSPTYPEGTNGQYVQTMLNGWSPYIKNISVHDNIIERSGANPTGELINQELDSAIPDVNIISGFTQTTSLNTVLGLISDRAGEKMPAVLYDGIGQFIIDQGMLADFDLLLAFTGADAYLDGVNYQPYEAKDRVCVIDNLDGNSAASAEEFTETNIGLVFTNDINDLVPAITNSIWDPASGNLPPPLFITEDFHGNSERLSCHQPRLPAAKVTFKGQVYGCAGDDLSEAACSL